MQKWITKYKGTGEAGYVCHFEGPLGNDSTLCGLSISNNPDLYEEDPKPIIYGKVNCLACKSIVAAVRKIKGNEIEK